MSLSFNFLGGESYSQKEMIELFKHVNVEDISLSTNNYNILEFGSGTSTITIC